MACLSPRKTHDSPCWNRSWMQFPGGNPGTFHWRPVCAGHDTSHSWTSLRGGHGPLPDPPGSAGQEAPLPAGRKTVIRVAGVPGIAGMCVFGSQSYSLVVFQDGFSEFRGYLYADLVQELGGEFAPGKDIDAVGLNTLVACSSIGQ